MRIRRPADQRVAHEAGAPPLVPPLRLRHRCARPHRPLAAVSSPHSQVLLAIPPQQLLVVHHDAVARQYAEPPAAEALPSVLDGPPTSARPHQFLRQPSFSMALSRIVSASGRLSRAFSS